MTDTPAPKPSLPPYRPSLTKYTGPRPEISYLVLVRVAGETRYVAVTPTWVPADGTPPPLGPKVVIDGIRGVFYTHPEPLQACWFANLQIVNLLIQAFTSVSFEVAVLPMSTHLHTVVVS